MSVSAIGGSLDYATLLSLIQPKASNKSHGPPLSKMQFSDIDADADGSISQTELQNALSPAGGTSDSSSAGDSRVANLFQKIDADGDGSISQSELSAFQQKMQASGHHRHHTSESTDSQASQTLNNLVTQLYKAADANGDGQLSQDELTSWLGGSTASTSVNQLA
jgi:Ca2+-binding EF-hand superfamily protein